MTKRKKRKEREDIRRKRKRKEGSENEVNPGQELLHRIILLALKQTLDPINDQPKYTKQVSEPEAPTPHTNCVDEEVNKRPVDNDKGQENAEAAPLVVFVDVQVGHVLRARLVGTILAVLCGGPVDQVSDLCEVVDEVACVFLAG